MPGTRSKTKAVATPSTSAAIKVDPPSVKDENTQDTLITIHSVQEVADFDLEELQQDDNERICEYFCVRCDETYDSMQEFQSHECYTPVEGSTIAPSIKRKPRKNFIPGSAELSYANPNPKNPCYCCGEDEHLGHLQGTFQCDQCNPPKKFQRNDGLLLHQVNLHTDFDQFACDQCPVKCLNQQIHEAHLETHKNSKPFNCSKCGKQFTRKYHLERHLVHTKCSDAPARPELTCEVCNKSFTRLDNLREHLRAHLGQNVRKREFQCQYCEKSFYGSSLLNIHIRTHTLVIYFNYLFD
jgi:hypothetical protein